MGITSFGIFFFDKSVSVEFPHRSFTTYKTSKSALLVMIKVPKRCLKALLKPSMNLKVPYAQDFSEKPLLKSTASRVLSSYTMTIISRSKSFLGLDMTLTSRQKAFKKTKGCSLMAFWHGNNS